MESERPWARAAIMREACDREDAPGAEGGWLQWLADCGIPAISGVDTRALVIHIRDRGAMRGGVFAAATPVDEARALIESEPPMAGRDLAAAGDPVARSAATARRTPGRTSPCSTPASRPRWCASWSRAARA